MNIIKGTYSSVWDVDGRGRGYVIETPCEIDLETGEIDSESCSEAETACVSILDREFCTVNDREFAVTNGEVADLSALKEFLSIPANEIIYLTNACGDDIGVGTLDLSKADCDKVAFEDGPGDITPYIVQIDNKKYVIGNLEVPKSEPGHEVRAYCEVVRKRLREHLTSGMKLLPLDEEEGKFVVSVAIPLDSLADSEATKAAFQTLFGKFVDLPDLEPGASPKM